MKKVIFLTTLLMLAVFEITADEIVATKSGKRVLLKDNFTWEYFNEDESAPNFNANDPVSVIEAYCKSTTWQDRLRYIRNPDKYENIFRERYSKDFSPLKYVRIEKPQYETVEIGKLNYVRIFVEGKAIFGGIVEVPLTYCLKRTEEGYKIDWEFSVGYNPISWTLFEATKPKEPIRMRAAASLDSSFPLAFDRYYNKEDYWCLKMYDDTGNYLFRSCVKKSHKSGIALLDLLKDGRIHRIVALMHYEVGDKNFEFVFIDELIKDSWFID